MHDVEVKSKSCSEAKSTERAVLLLGHGSRRGEANDVLRHMAAALQDLKRFGVVAPAFLHFEKPDFHEGLAALLRRGFRDIIVMPYFLYCGAHVLKDIPVEMNLARVKYPDLKIRITENLGFHDKLLDIVVQRLSEAMASETGT